MTPRQKEAMAFIQKFMEEHSYSPSLDEIAEGLGLAAKSGACRLVQGLEAQGLIKRRPGMVRNIVIADIEHPAVGHLRAVLAQVRRTHTTSPAITAATSYLRSLKA